MYLVEELLGSGRPQAGAYRGFSTHAGVTAHARDERRRRRLLEYCLRPPVAEKHVTCTTDGRLAIELHHPRPSGATHVVMEPLGLLKKLAALIYPPGLHRTRYFGVLSSASKHRPFVVPRPP